MHVIKSDPSLSKAGIYREIGVHLAGLFSGERNGLANAANTCALLYHMLPDVNWVGFYFLQGAELVLGPFQGKVACVRIAMGRGVCGTAAVVAIISETTARRIVSPMAFIYLSNGSTKRTP